MKNLKKTKVTVLKNLEIEQTFGGGNGPNLIKIPLNIDPISPVLDLLKTSFKI